MLEKEIQFLSDFNLNKIKTLGSNITFEKLLNTEIHPAILQYISGELDYLIFADRYKLLENSDFDYSGSVIAEYFNHIAKEIKRTKKLSSDELKKYVEKAIVFNVNYLTEPRSLITKLVFRDNRNSITVSEINVFFNFTYYYDYLKDIFSSYAEKRKVVSLNSKELELILSKIDDELFTVRSEELITDALFSMSDFFNQGGVNKTLIPVIFIENYLKEKNLSDYLSRLTKGFPDNKKKAEIDELKFVLFSKAFVMDTVEEIKEAIQERSENETLHKEPELSAPAVKTEKPSVHQDEKQKEESKKSEPVHEEEKHAAEKRKPDRKSDYEEIELEELDEYETRAKDLKSPKVVPPQKTDEKPKERSDDIPRYTYKETEKNMKDIFGFLSDKEIEKIVSIVFNEDRDDFANTLEKLSACKSYDDATEILKSVFFTYRVNPYSKEAITLTNAVSGYFDQAE
jgi:hypothetical protein